MNRCLILLSSVFLTVLTFSITGTANSTELAGAELSHGGGYAQQGDRGSSRIALAPSRLVALDVTSF